MKEEKAKMYPDEVSKEIADSLGIEVPKTMAEWLRASNQLDIETMTIKDREKLRDKQVEVLKSIQEHPEQWSEGTSVQVETTEEQREKLRELRDKITLEKAQYGSKPIRNEETGTKKDPMEVLKSIKVVNTKEYEQEVERQLVEEMSKKLDNHGTPAGEGAYEEVKKLWDSIEEKTEPGYTLTPEQIALRDRINDANVPEMISEMQYISMEEIKKIADRNLKEVQQMKADKVLEIMRTLPEELQVEIALQMMNRVWNSAENQKILKQQDNDTKE